MPELGPDTKFSLSSHKAVEEYKEAKEVCELQIFTHFVNLYFKLFGGNDMQTCICTEMICKHIFAVHLLGICNVIQKGKV